MQINIQKMTCTRLPTPEGDYQLCLYRNSQDDKEHLVLVTGDVAGQADVLVRVHSECFTGDTLGSLRCDCGPQLNQAMRLIADERQGIIIYLRQEGRGIGLLDKLRAYNLQDEGYDTVEANLMLGHQADGRDYTIAALILKDWGIRSLRLLTNNPGKMESLQRLGLVVADRVPLQTGIHAENAAYLTTKVKRMRHLLNLEELAPIAHQNGHHPSLPLAEVSRNPPGNGRPLVTLSYAQSLDGSITARHGEPMAISGGESMAMTHQLRADHDAILIGINTALADDPSLTVRLVQGIDPQPIILDSHLRFSSTAKMLQNQAHQPWIATTEKASYDRQKLLEAAGARILRLPANEDGQVDLGRLLKRLKILGVNNLMVEGGSAVITSFLTQRLVDRLVMTIAPIMVGGINAIGKLMQDSGNEYPHLENLRPQSVGDDLIITGDVVWKSRK